MPLARVQVRNEYGLGQPELYREANREDPKALLDGVAVAGLVGILRQLGDLAEFAAEVFHGLQEQVMSTSSRSHKLMIRVQRIEAALPPLEKAMLAQKSHLHFAYTVGSDWHAHLPNEQNHFMDVDLPPFIMDSYEECRDPPRLHLLDKFDTGGPGSCLKRYSDPTFFRRASAGSGEANVEKVSKDRKAHRSKKKRIRQRNEVCHGASISNHSDRVVDDDFPRSVSQEQTCPSSSCVTWDEKTEIVESMCHQYDRDGTSEMITMNCDGDTQHRNETEDMLTMNCDGVTQEKGAINLRNVDQMDFQFDNEGTPTSIFGQNQLDDIESEPDHYMDALNTIESEPETDLDWQTKRKMERSSNCIYDRTQDGMHELTAHHSDLQSSNLESHTAAYGSSNKVTSFDKPNSISSEFYTHEELPQMAGESSNIGNSLGVDFCGNNNILDGSNVESEVSNLPYSGSAEPNLQVPLNEKIISTSSESQKSPTEPSGVESFKFWTNGGLLGLEPSKPPDFSVLNAIIQDSLARSKDDTTSTSSQSNTSNGDGDVGKPDKLVQSSKSIEYISHPSNGFNNNRGHSLSETTAIPETEQAVTPDVKAKSTEDSQRDGENASQIFGLSNRFLVNGFQRNVSLVHDEKSEDSEPPCSRKTDFYEQKSKNQSVVCQTFLDKTFKGYFGSGSPIDSPSSSPPLQQMKISFQPINGFETSKLKLKFPNGSYCHDSSRDMLPSFQLVPDLATPQNDMGSDSDDDTFCRSSPYLSDDCLSHHSGSNSEQWESDDIPTSKDNELYDALRRISLTESVSSSLEPEGTGRGSIRVDHDLQTPFAENSLELCQSGHSLELPSLSTVNPLFEQEIKKGSDAKDLPESPFPKEPTPLPPPLPPLQWRVMKPHSDMIISKQDSISEALNHAFDMKTLQSSISPQSKPNSVKQQQNTDEAVAFTQRIKPKWQKPEGQKEVNQAINGRGVDEKEDFLHQIRTKSFSLRRTMTEKPTITPGPTANVKVTAILEKANAIRQAVGTDDGEDDDNWSDP